ncbi:glutathione S-transferase [Loktanella sp. DSM 29012]|uniref:glutathione S-transferase n=1 Tax=Loktanella sp. DSM 29012 TaxID=1881056 RepID=UPI0008BA1ACD|nr:glutathione S-transferase [Loktanella sp. DSM 29012]SEP75862.1 glutathione S-transferase [Loktanella sp. DSM 29012]
MTYDLFIGDRTFSSWSLRGWLMLEAFDLPYRSHVVGLYSGTMAADLADLAPARTVPVLRTPRGHVLTDSIAMAETLAEAHPQAGLYPADPGARALARSLVAEMHSGFAALRGDCPMMLAHGWQGFTPGPDVLADLARLETLWALARARHEAGGPWLFGTYSLADVFYAPAALRIATYDLPVSDAAQAYVAAHLNDPLIRQWRAMGLTQSYDPMPYAMDLPKRPWPGPAPLHARAVDQGTAENRTCPYSGDPVTHLMTMDGRTFGFCNAFCRDKTVADPAAWPKFMALV